MAEVEVTGAEQAGADIAQWASQLPADISDDLRGFGNELVSILSSKQPHISGTLAGSAELVPSEVDTFFGLALGREVVYAGWVEFGGARGRDYVPQGRTVYPTAIVAEGQYDRLVEKATQDSINRFPWHQATS
jgi:hypothetical protein